MLDFDLAEIYGVETKYLKRAVRSNMKRFEGDDFMFEVTKDELLRCKICTLNKKGRGQHFKYMPFAFTELGVSMLSSVLNSDTAIDENKRIMRAFVALRQLVFNPSVQTNELEQEVKELKQYIEDVFADYNDINEDTRIQLEQINRTLAEMQVQNRLQAKPRRRIGFISEEQRKNNEDIIE